MHLITVNMLEYKSHTRKFKEKSGKIRQPKGKIPLQFLVRCTYGLAPFGNVGAENRVWARPVPRRTWLNERPSSGVPLLPLGEGSPVSLSLSLHAVWQTWTPRRWVFVRQPSVTDGRTPSRARLPSCMSRALYAVVSLPPLPSMTRCRCDDMTTRSH